MPHIFGVQDLDLDGRDEAFSSPTDPIIGVHRVMVGKCDVGHAEPAGFIVQKKRINMAGRDDVIRVESMDVEVGRLPALSQKTTGFAGV
jgi:hypothetical protein